LDNLDRKPNTSRTPNPIGKSTPAPGTMTITIQLYFVPDKSMADFQIQAFESHDRILQNIRQRFGVPFVAVYTQDAKTQPDDLRKVLQGQILLVATSPFTRPQPYSPLGFKFYQGEESAFVHPSFSSKSWTVSRLGF
jgi:hypothetical protein